MYKGLYMDKVTLSYTHLTHWVKVESQNHDFYMVSDDYGNMIIVEDDVNLFSLTGFWM